MFKPINYDFNGEVERWRVGEKNQNLKRCHQDAKNTKENQKKFLVLKP